MCACLLREYLCHAAFRCVVMSVSRARRASHRGSFWRRKVAISFCRSHTRDNSAPRPSQRTSQKYLKQMAILHGDLVNQCLELAVIQAAGEDGVDDLHHNRHDVNEVGRLSLLVNDAVSLVYGLGVSGGFTVTRHQRSGALLLPYHRWGTVGRHADKTGEIQEVLLQTLKHL